MAKVFQNLFIGGAMEANNRNLLNSLKITDILIVAKELPEFHPLIYNYKKIEAKDNVEFNLSIYFNEMAEFIYTKRKNGSVFVHCMFGQSRSATAILCYLIKYENMSLKKGLIFLNSKKKIFPNKGFINQLKEWEKFISKQKFNKQNQILEFNYKQFKTGYYNSLYDKKNKSDNFFKSMGDNKNIILASKDEQRNIIIKNNIINNYFISNKKHLSKTKSINKKITNNKSKKKKNFLNLYKNNIINNDINKDKIDFSQNNNFNIYKTTNTNEKKNYLDLKKKNKKINVKKKKDIIEKNEEIINKNILSNKNLCIKLNNNNYFKNKSKNEINNNIEKNKFNYSKNNSSSILKSKNFNRKLNKKIKSNNNNFNSSNLLNKLKSKIITEEKKKIKKYFCLNCKKLLFNDNLIKFHCNKTISESICNYYFLNEASQKNFTQKKDKNNILWKCKNCNNIVGEKNNNPIMCSCGNLENNSIRIKKRKIINK